MPSLAENNLVEAISQIYEHYNPPNLGQGEGRQPSKDLGLELDTSGELALLTIGVNSRKNNSKFNLKKILPRL